MSRDRPSTEVSRKPVRQSSQANLQNHACHLSRLHRLVRSIPRVLQHRLAALSERSRVRGTVVLHPDPGTETVQRAALRAELKDTRAARPRPVPSVAGVACVAECERTGRIGAAAPVVSVVVARDDAEQTVVGAKGSAYGGPPGVAGVGAVPEFAAY